MFAREFGFTPEQTKNLSFVERWMLIEGMNEDYEAVEKEEDDYYDPRFPRASRGDKMASAEELMAFGIQYSRE